MAGMLPGVEAARRRRIHQRGIGGNGWSEFSSGGLVGGGLGCTRRPVFCLFASSFESNQDSAIMPKQGRSVMNRACEDEMLGRLAREAKERLDERLKAQRSSLINRVKSDLSEERVRGIDGRPTFRELRTEVYRSNKKKKIFVLMRWASKLGGKKSREVKEYEEEECAICLEQFKVEDTLVNLPCTHRFHYSCLLPWLQDHALCPCCRMTILP